MLIKKGTLLNVNHSRKGDFVGFAIQDFDTDTTEFYPIAVAEHKIISGASMFAAWRQGDEVPCRKSLCQISERKS